MLKSASEEEKQVWLTKSGQDWSGAFGHDPRAYVDRKGRKIAEPGADRPPHDPYNPSSDDDDDDAGGDDSSSDLGITDGTNASTKKRSSMDTTRSGMTGYSSMDGSPTSRRDSNNLNKATEKRKHRGLMQWKPARNVAFAKHQAQFGISKIKRRFSGSLAGREPGIETEAAA